MTQFRVIKSIRRRQDSAASSPKGMQKVAVGNAHGSGAAQMADPEGVAPGGPATPSAFRVGMTGHDAIRRLHLRLPTVGPYRGHGDGDAGIITHLSQ